MVWPGALIRSTSILIRLTVFIYTNLQHMSDHTVAPGFNHSIACMVAAVGVGHMVASRAPGGAAHPSVCESCPSFNVHYAR